jgi:hypothetical protein
MAKSKEIEFFKDVGKVGSDTVKVAGQAIIAVGAVVLTTSLIKNASNLFVSGGEN